MQHASSRALPCPDETHAGNVSLTCMDGVVWIDNEGCLRHCPPTNLISVGDVAGMRHGQILHDAPCTNQGSVVIECQNGEMRALTVCVASCAAGMFEVPAWQMGVFHAASDDVVPVRHGTISHGSERVSECEAGRVGSVTLSCFKARVSYVSGGCFASCDGGVSIDFDQLLLARDVFDSTVASQAPSNPAEAALIQTRRDALPSGIISVETEYAPHGSVFNLACPNPPAQTATAIIRCNDTRWLVDRPCGASRPPWADELDIIAQRVVAGPTFNMWNSSGLTYFEGYYYEPWNKTTNIDEVRWKSSQACEGCVVMLSPPVTPTGFACFVRLNAIRAFHFSQYREDVALFAELFQQAGSPAAATQTGATSQSSDPLSDFTYAQIRQGLHQTVVMGLPEWNLNPVRRTRAIAGMQGCHFLPAFRQMPLAKTCSMFGRSTKRCTTNPQETSGIMV